jgi:predicted nucleotidyltransferase
MNNVIEQHRDEVVALCKRVGARRLDAFGSAVRADFDLATSYLDSSSNSTIFHLQSMPMRISR